MSVSLKKALSTGVALAGLAGVYMLSLERPQNASPVEPVSTGSTLPKPAPESPDELNDRDSDLASATDPGRVERAGPIGPVLLWGTVQTESGEVVSGEEVQLYSATLNEKHRSISNDHGEFVMHDVTPAADYSVSVSPRGMFARYQRDVAIDQNQIDLNIVLRSLPTASMTGWVVDTTGNPVPAFDLVIRSPARARWSATVTTDAGGRFEVNRVPEGRLEVSTRTLQTGQLMKITGLELVAGSTRPVKLVVDAGTHMVSGRVYDALGSPVAGANVLLTWTHSEATVRSIATRRTITDPDGGFTLDGLGAGPHELIVSFGGQGQRRKIEVGQDNLPVDLVLDLSD